MRRPARQWLMDGRSRTDSDIGNLRPAASACAAGGVDSYSGRDCLAVAMGSVLPLTPKNCRDVSKARRGYRLDGYHMRSAHPACSGATL